MKAPHDNLRLFQEQVGIWGDATFPYSTGETVLSHLTEELLEWRGVEKEHIPTLMGVIEAFAGEAPVFDGEEGVDVFLLILHYFHKGSLDLMDLAWGKMMTNRARTWSAIPESVGGHWKHVDGASTEEMAEALSEMATTGYSSSSPENEQ